MRTAVRSILLCVLSLASASAWAVDGVVEINQAKALAGGVTPGDGAGFPIAITASGSYRLTSDLTVDNVNLTAIDLDDGVDHVTIDLNGFTVSGPVTCTPGNPVVCAPTGNGQGIAGSLNDDVVLTNGTIRGFAVRGVILGSRARVERVHAVGNGSDGMNVDNDSSVESSTGAVNGGNGIRCAYGCRIAGCNASENGMNGIYTSIGGVVTASAARANVGHGIYALAGSHVFGSTARGNAGFGLRLESGAFGDDAFSDNNGGNASAQIGGAGRVALAPSLCGTALCP